MNQELRKTASKVSAEFTSIKLERLVKVDFYLPPDLQIEKEGYSLLLINDGQDLITMNFLAIYQDFLNVSGSSKLMCVGIHCGEDRKNEYGTACTEDYKGRGSKAGLYTKMIFDELLPFVRTSTGVEYFNDKSFCGFSLGGLSALDIVWNHPEEFLNVGVFSGSLWWRNLSQDDISYNDHEHRIMHLQIRSGHFYPWLNFFFESGTLDETADRNGNGIIDAIDDTLALINELYVLGYSEQQIKYLEIENGKHDIYTWSSAFPEFLKWRWG